MTNSWIDDLPELPDLPTGDQRQAIMIPKREQVVKRHYGPGPHPGTGTEQTVHAGDGKAPSEYNEQEELSRVWYEGPFGKETIGEWLERQEIERTEGGNYKFYHAVPKSGSRHTSGVLKPGALLETDPEKAAFFAARDRDLDPKKDIVVYELHLRPSQINGGHWASLTQEVQLKDHSIVERHYGPGPHPGTGTEQTVHAGNGAAARPSVEYPSEISEGAAKIHSVSVEREPEITDTVKALAEQFNAKMDGLDYRLKTEESIARKINKWITETGLSMEDALREATYDAVRYTMIFERETFVRDVKKVQEELSRQGWVKYDNLWKNYFTAGDTYDGYNTVYVNEAGDRFELQFHTPDTKVRQKKGWPIYDEWRAEKDESKRTKFWNQMVVLWEDYDKPDGWETLEGVRK